MVADTNSWTVSNLRMARGDNTEGDIENGEIAMRGDSKPRLERRHFDSSERGICILKNLM